MKKLWMIILILAIVPIANAELNLDEIKGYINNERVSAVDKDGGDFEVEPKDIIDLVITLDNTENTTTKARLKGILQDIDNGDDIVKEQDWYDIGAETDRTKSLSFSIPSDVNVDEYRLDLTIYYRFSNDTEGEHETDFDVIVKKVGEDEVVDLHEILTNMTTSCISLAKTADTCFNYIGVADNCSSELSTVKEERGTYKQKSDDLEGIITELRRTKSEIESEKINLENQVKTMIPYSQCSNQTATAVAEARRESDSKNQQLLGFGALIVGGYFWWQKKKKAKSTVADSYYYEKK